MVLVLSRGAFCPKDRRQAEGLLQLHREMEVGYCRLVTISTDNITQTNENRSGIGAHWPFLSDPRRIVQKDLDIAEYTDPVNNPMIPHVIVLEPGLVIHKIYNGYWFFGRPTIEELRQDLRAVSRKCRPDWDITTPELKAAWQQGRKELFYPYGKSFCSNSRRTELGADAESAQPLSPANGTRRLPLSPRGSAPLQFSSPGPGNKSGHAGLHHRVEPDVRGDAVPNFPHGVFRQGRNVKVLLDALRFGRGGQESGAALYGPGQRNLSRRLVHTLCDGCNHRVVQQVWLHGMSQRRKRLQHNPMLPAEVEQLPFGEIRMRFDLHHGRLDPRDRNDLSQLLQRNVRQADRLAVTVVHEALQRPPRLHQRNARIIDHLTVLVPRVLLVAGLKGKGGVDDIAIDIVELQSPAARIEGRLDPLRTMIGVP